MLSAAWAIIILKYRKPCNRSASLQPLKQIIVLDEKSTNMKKKTAWTQYDVQIKIQQNQVKISMITLIKLITNFSTSETLLEMKEVCHYLVQLGLWGVPEGCAMPQAGRTWFTAHQCVHMWWILTASFCNTAAKPDSDFQSNIANDLEIGHLPNFLNYEMVWRGLFSKTMRERERKKVELTNCTIYFIF